MDANAGLESLIMITRDEITEIIMATGDVRLSYAQRAADAILARLGDGWKRTVGVIGGPYLLYFPATTGRNAQTEFMDVGRLPCPFPRKPSHYISLPSPPKESA